jgi:hypothetical protein
MTLVIVRVARRSGLSLLTGGRHCSEAVVKTGLIVHTEKDGLYMTQCSLELVNLTYLIFG